MKDLRGPAPEGKETEFRAALPQDGDYEPVGGLDEKSVEMARVIEARASAKTASDYQHIIWAYGVVWSLFAVYGIYLWRRATRLRSDVDELSRKLASHDS
jgi:hypothetical protein